MTCPSAQPMQTCKINCTELDNRYHFWVILKQGLVTATEGIKGGGGREIEVKKKKKRGGGGKIP